RLPEIQSIRDRVEHGFRRHVRFGGMQRGRKLNAVHAELFRKIEPFLDGAVGILVANLARRQFLKRRGQHSDLHEFRFEVLDWHWTPSAVENSQKEGCPQERMDRSQWRLTREIRYPHDRIIL